jgi:muconolactone delta-isomerase
MEDTMKKYYLLYFSLALAVGFFLSGAVNVCAQQAKAKEKIKFLVLSETKDVFYSMSANERKKIEEATTNLLKQDVKNGAILKFYNIPGWNRSISIEQYESVEELYKHFEGSPIYPYVRFEVYPIQKAEIMTEGAGKEKANSKMKFLVINEAKDIWYALPANERKKIEEANTAYITKAIKAGDFLELFSIPGWNRAASIEQYDSLDAIYKHFEEDPYYPYAKFEVYPLLENDLAK